MVNHDLYIDNIGHSYSHTCSWTRALNWISMSAVASNRSAITIIINSVKHRRPDYKLDFTASEWY